MTLVSRGPVLVRPQRDQQETEESEEPRSLVKPKACRSSEFQDQLPVLNTGTGPGSPQTVMEKNPKRTYRFRVQLVERLSQHLIHAGSICKGDEAEAPVETNAAGSADL